MGIEIPMDDLLNSSISEQEISQLLSNQESNKVSYDNYLASIRGFIYREGGINLSHLEALSEEGLAQFLEFKAFLEGKTLSHFSKEELISQVTSEFQETKSLYKLTPSGIEVDGGSFDRELPSYLSNVVRVVGSKPIIEAEPNTVTVVERGIVGGEVTVSPVFEEVGGVAEVTVASKEETSEKVIASTEVVATPTESVSVPAEGESPNGFDVSDFDIGELDFDLDLGFPEGGFGDPSGSELVSPSNESPDSDTDLVSVEGFGGGLFSKLGRSVEQDGLRVVDSFNGLFDGSGSEPQGSWVSGNDNLEELVEVVSAKEVPEPSKDLGNKGLELAPTLEEWLEVPVPSSNGGIEEVSVLSEKPSAVSFEGSSEPKTSVVPQPKDVKPTQTIKSRLSEVVGSVLEPLAEAYDLGEDEEKYQAPTNFPQSEKDKRGEELVEFLSDSATLAAKAALSLLKGKSRKV